MAIEDSNPERRNLVVLSMAIIAFYVGGCEIPPTGEIELPLIKLKFTDAYHLAWLVWIMLCWFLFRYWVAHHHMIEDLINQELHEKRYGLSLFTRTIKWRLKIPPNVSAGNVHFVRYAHGNTSHLCLVDPIDPDDPQEYDESDRRHAIQPSVRDGFRLRLILLVACVKLFFTYPSLTAYYIPYILALTAIALGLCHEVEAIHPLFEWLCGIFH